MGKGVGEGGCINMDLCTKRGMVYGITDLSEADEICYESPERDQLILCSSRNPLQSRLSPVTERRHRAGFVAPTTITRR